MCFLIHIVTLIQVLLVKMKTLLSDNKYQCFINILPIGPRSSLKLFPSRNVIGELRRVLYHRACALLDMRPFAGNKGRFVSLPEVL